MTTLQGNLELLNEPLAQRLLTSTLLARLAYAGPDGTPRVVPIWFHWTGQAIVMGTPIDAQKVDALRARPRVAITIDSDAAPYEVLMIRGAATVEVVHGVVPEYALAAERYQGTEAGRKWAADLGSLDPTMARIAVTPNWVGLIDFQTRFPQELTKILAKAAR